MFGFVLEEKYVCKDQRKVTSKICFTNQVEISFKIFFQGNAENIIDLIVIHERIIQDMKLRSNMKAIK